MRSRGLAVLCAGVMTVTLGASAMTAATAAPVVGGTDTAPIVTRAVAHDTSVPLRSMAPLMGTSTPVARKPSPGGRITAMNNQQLPPPSFPAPTGPVGDAAMPPVGLGFDGQQNMSGYYPPDTDGDIGLNHYVQMVNATLAIYDKHTGALAAGPMMISTLWAGFGGDCETFNDGDPIVRYDPLANRWLISQFSVTSASTGDTPYYECVAISATSDPAGAYNRYAFAYTDLPDYPKFGVWPDGYYVTYNMFADVTFDFLGTKSCALDRAAMIAGTDATQICFDSLATGPNPEFGLLPSDLDGRTPPPVGSPNYLVALPWSAADSLTMYRMHIDWVTPGSSSYEGPLTIPVNPFVWACTGQYRTQCVIQPGTGVRLESLGDRLMNRLAYRNYGDHESLVVTHTVAIDASDGLNQTGIAWYELRAPGTTPAVFQQGTTADPSGSAFRWMGSMAMDHQGNMALGYSASSATRYPSIAYVGRLATDPLNTLPTDETTIIDGTASQIGTAARWGDYSSMTVDPVDDCTFWYTNEYLNLRGNKTWRTRIASFTFPSCPVPGAPTGVTSTPATASAVVGWTAPTYTGSSALTGFTATAVPGGATCSAGPAASGCTITGLPAGAAYTVTVTATNSNGTGPASAPADVTVPKIVQTIRFTSTAPTSARIGGPAYVVTAVGGASGNPVVFDSATRSVCSVSGATVTFRTEGTCRVTANQAGNSSYLAAGQASQSFAVGPRAQVPVTPLGLPTALNNEGWTKLIAAYPVVTNAGQTARVVVTATVRPSGTPAAYSTRVSAGALWVWLPGTQLATVVVSVRAPAVTGYSSLSTGATYYASRA